MPWASTLRSIQDLCWLYHLPEKSSAIAFLQRISRGKGADAVFLPEPGRLLRLRLEVGRGELLRELPSLLDHWRWISADHAAVLRPHARDISDRRVVPRDLVLGPRAPCPSERVILAGFHVFD